MSDIMQKHVSRIKQIEFSCNITVNNKGTFSYTFSYLPRYNERISHYTKANATKTCFHAKNTSRDKAKTLDTAECSETLQITVCSCELDYVVLQAFS